MTRTTAEAPEVLGLAVDTDRLLADLDAVNRFGASPERPGLNRPAFSDADMAARHWLMARMAEARLAPRMDGVGNVFGRWETGRGPAVLAGSHLDTVPEGGRFDGALGTLAALEAVRAMRDAGLAPRRPVEVVCTADEEGRFGGMLGSQAIVGEVGPDWIARAVDEHGCRLRDALARVGLDATPSPRAAADIAVFLELHIEQGPVLEREGLALGIASAISGVFVWTVRLRGAANHSGTTPMDLRRDAFRGLAEFGTEIGRIVAGTGSPEARLTVGEVRLSPGTPHSIAGEGVFSLVGRDTDAGVMRAMAEACRDAIRRAATTHGLGVEIAERSLLAPGMLDAGVRGRLAALAGESGLSVRTMSCGAGHDAQTFARHVPAGLILVPSKNGISHAPEEWTAPEHIAAGATLLARAMAAYARDA